KDKPKPVKWKKLWIFAARFLVIGVVSEAARLDAFSNARLFNLFENFYRFGAIVFGGGQVLLPMMLFQFVNRPQNLGMAPLLSSDHLLTGYGMVQAVPGPVFAISSYVGGMIMSQYGVVWQ